MAYKRLGKRLSFADLAVSKLMENNRSVKMMEKIDKVVNWKNVEALLKEYYEVGRSKEARGCLSPGDAIKMHASSEVVSDRIGP